MNDSVARNTDGREIESTGQTDPRDGDIERRCAETGRAREELVGRDNRDLVEGKGCHDGRKPGPRRR